MQKAPTATGERKRRIVTEEEREQLHAADSLVELALIFDTSAGKKGAFGGFGQDARESTERTIRARPLSAKGTVRPMWVPPSCAHRTTRPRVTFAASRHPTRLVASCLL
jgi:hypothetical protein